MGAISAHMTKLSCAHLHHMMLYGQRTSRRYSGEAPSACAMCAGIRACPCCVAWMHWLRQDMLLGCHLPEA